MPISCFWGIKRFFIKLVLIITHNFTKDIKSIRKSLIEIHILECLAKNENDNKWVFLSSAPFPTQFSIILYNVGNHWSDFQCLKVKLRLENSLSTCMKELIMQNGLFEQKVWQSFIQIKKKRFFCEILENCLAFKTSFQLKLKNPQKEVSNQTFIQSFAKTIIKKWSDGNRKIGWKMNWNKFEF